MSNEEKPLTIVVCIPGNHFSNNFMICWTDFLEHIFERNIRLHYSFQVGGNIYDVRNACLGGNPMKGPEQLPFQGRIDYDYIFWIDSDQVFTFEQFEQLMSRDVDFVSGLYRTTAVGEFPAVVDWDEDYFIKNERFNRLTPEDIYNTEELIEVVFNGFGFVLMKKGVLEKIPYPWFKPTSVNIGGINHLMGEDVAICRELKEQGVSIYVDPLCVVGHEKTFMI